MLAQLKKYMELNVNTNIAYTIAINNKILTVDNKMIYARLKLENSKTIRLEIGNYIKINNKSRFQDRIDLLEEQLLSYSYSSNFGEVDLGISKDDFMFEFAFNSDLGIITITSNIFKLLLDNIYVEEKQGRIQISDRVITDSERLLIYDYLDTYSIYAYKDMLERKIYRKLSKSKKLTFFYLFNVYRPILVQGKCVFNPLMSAKRHRKVLDESLLFKVAKCKEEQVSDLFVYFITDKLACDCLNFRGYTRLNNSFLSDVLFGLFNNSFPNSRNSIYVNKYNREAIQPHIYESLGMEDRKDYSRITTLYALCSAYSISLGSKNASSLYSIVDRAELLR